MATLREQVKSVLTSDATLMALLTGGIKDAQELPPDGGSLKDAPKAANGVSLAPHATIRWRGDRPFSAETLGAEQTTCEVYLYDHIGYVKIEEAIGLIKPLLHRHRFQVSDRDFVYTNWVQNMGEMNAPEYAGAPMRFMRFEVTTVR
jgi:hypothetical protein